MIWYQLVEPEAVIEDAFNGVLEQVQKGLEKDLMIIESELPK